MAIDVSVDTLIRRLRAEVARYAMAPENEPIWISGITHSKLLTDPPVRVGTQVEHGTERKIVIEVRGRFRCG